MLCTLCQNIQFKQYPELTREEKIYLLTYHDEGRDLLECCDDMDEVLSSGLEIFGDGTSFYFHYRNLESLREAADDGCNFCCQIYYGLFETAVLDRNVEYSSERLYLNLQVPFNNHRPEDHLDVGELGVHLGENSLASIRLKDLDGR